MDKRTKFAKCRVTPAEEAWIKRAARAEGMGDAAWIRRAVFAALPDELRDPPSLLEPEPEVQSVPRSVRQVAAAATGTADTFGTGWE